MKKALGISFVMFGVIFLAGCGKQPVNQIQPTESVPMIQASDQPSVVDQSTPDVKTQSTIQPTTSTAQPIPINKGVGLVYKNEKYGFEFTFDSGYKNLWGFYTENVANENLLDSFHFTVTDNPSPIFIIHVHDKNWWLKNAVIDANKSAWRIGEKHSLSSTLGIYLGSSNKFAYTLHPNNQSCPDLGEEPAPLCELTYGKTEMVTNSFKITNK